MIERFIQTIIITASLQAIVLAQSHPSPAPPDAIDGPTPEVVAMLEKLEDVLLNR